MLTHWSRVMHICVGKLTIIGSDNGLSPGRRQAIIWTNAGILLIGPLVTNFSEILIAIEAFSFRKMHLKILSAKRRPFCIGLNVLRTNRILLYRVIVSRLSSFHLMGILTSNSTNPLHVPEPMLTYHQWGSVAISWGVGGGCYQFTKWKKSLVNLQSHSPETNGSTLFILDVPYYPCYWQTLDHLCKVHCCSPLLVQYHIHT